MNNQSKNLPYIFVVVGICIYSTWIFEIFLNAHMSLTQSYVSELAVHGQPNDYYFRTANLLGSSCMSAGILMLFDRIKNTEYKRAAIFLGIMSIVSLVGVINAIFPMDCAPSESYACLVAQDHYRINLSQWVHQVSAIIMFGGLLFVQFYSTFYIFKQSTRLFWVSLSNMIIQFLLNIAVCIICLFDLTNVGIFQRISLLLFSMWVLIIFYLLKTRPKIFLKEFNELTRTEPDRTSQNDIKIRP